MNKQLILNREVPTQSIAVLLLVSMLAWTVGFSVFTHRTHAAVALMNISDTMSESRLNQKSNHNIVFQVSSTFAVNDSFTVVLPAGFTGSVGYADIDLNFGSSTAFVTSTGVFTSASGTTLGASTQPGQWGVSSSSNSYTFTSPAGNTSHIPTNGEYIQVLMGTNATTGGTGTNQFTNPSSAGTQVIYVDTIAGVTGDYGEAAVVITTGVTMSGSVSSSLQFVVSGVAANTTIAGNVTTIVDVASNGTSLPFGVIGSSTPSTPAHRSLSQKLAVQTNANNGFIVKVRQTQNFQSAAYGANADFDPFDNNNFLTGHAAIISPVAWSLNAPSYTDEATWGQYGISSDDTDLSTDTGMATDNFGLSTTTLLFAGNFNTSTAPGRNIFAYTGGPIDGLGLSHASGQAHVVYRVEATSLQEAASDYSTTFIYTVVPVY
ncbi:MAG: hypothetical protein HZA35_03300 [Parcubacteria group bacterium]|nr:hypothetical protein [Parcubacteria group bacterium]